MELNQRFKETCRRLQITPQQHLLLAVSGGLDSMSLLQLCLDAGFHVTVLHVNFKLRGTESDADQALVEARCKSAGIESRVKSLPIDKAHLKDGLQAEARRLRYAWFEEIMAETCADHLLTAHHLNDRLETFFIHLLRGSGVKGLASIPEHNDYILRPLLGFTRAELEAYAKTIGLKWREDASNASDDYLRNRIRHHLIPEMLNLSPDALPMAARSIDFIGEANAFIAQSAEKFAEAHLTAMPHGMLRLPLHALKQLDHSRTLAKYFFENLGFDPEGMLAVLDLIGSPSHRGSGVAGKMVEGSRLDAWRDRDSVVFAPSNPPLQKSVEITTMEGHLSEPVSMRWKQIAASRDTENVDESAGFSALLALDKLQFPLELRPWIPGDRFVPSGMSGSKKISDFLTDLKLSVPEKRHVWVLCSGGEICLVIGHRADDRFIWKGVGAALRMEVLSQLPSPLDLKSK